MTKTEIPYYNFDKMESFNAVYNFVVAARGNGKTFGRKEKAINAFFKKGEQFFYLRRYKPELRGVDTFFADIDWKFPDYDFRVNGGKFEVSPIETRDDKPRHWDVIGYYGALSQSQHFKSVAYPRVTSIIFDEFIIEKGNVHYLPDEAVRFNNFFSTVDRNKDKTRVWFLANAVSIDNPYFLAYDILPDKGDQFITKEKGFIACHFVDDQSFKEAVYASRFGQFIANQEYSEYAVENVFRDNNDGMIARRTSSARYKFTIETAKGTFAVWMDDRPRYLEFYLTQWRPKKESMFTLIPENIRPDKVYLDRSDKLTGYIKTAWRHGRMYFDSPPTRNAFLEIMR